MLMGTPSREQITDGAGRRNTREKSLISQQGRDLCKAEGLPLDQRRREGGAYTQVDMMLGASGDSILIPPVFSVKKEAAENLERGRRVGDVRKKS